jgi:hypothetical protein
MYRVNLPARRARTTTENLGDHFYLCKVLATIIVAVLVLTGNAADATADVTGNSRFMSGVYESGSVTSTTTVSRSTYRGTEPRRSRRAVSTSTEIDDFDVPTRQTRRATSTRRAQRAATTTTTGRSTPRRVRVAALTSSDFQTYDVPTRTTPRRARTVSTGRVGLPSVRAPRPSLTGGGIAWRANAGCLAGNLRSIVASVASSFGSVTVNSTCRSRSHNRRVGGASRSWHLTGNAVDFRVHGASIARVAAYLRTNVGGFKHYGGGLFHIDNGPRRSF